MVALCRISKPVIAVACVAVMWNSFNEKKKKRGKKERKKKEEERIEAELYRIPNIAIVVA